MTDTRELNRMIDDHITRDDRDDYAPEVHTMDQYSDEWWELRSGRFTASQASKLLTPTGKVSTQYKPELGRLIAEMVGLQEPERSEFSTEWMDRGSDLEAEARRWLAVSENLDLEEVGMVTDGSKVIGASPDAIHHNPAAFEIIPCEIKVPKPGTHIRWLLDGGLPKEHKQQVHFQIAVCGSSGGFFMSYHPELEPLIVWVEADEYTDAMADAIETFKQDYEKAFRRIVGGG